MSDCKVPVIFDQESSFPNEVKELGLAEAIHKIFEQTAVTVGTRLVNPLWHIIYKQTGQNYAFTSLEKVSNRNGDSVRAEITKYVRKRINGEKRSQVSKDADILSLFLQSPDIFTEEVIVDELIDFFVAA